MSSARDKQRDMSPKEFYWHLDEILGRFTAEHWGCEYKYLEMKRGAGWSKVTILFNCCRLHIYIAEKGVTFMATTPMNLCRRELNWYDWQDGDDHEDVLSSFDDAIQKIYGRIKERPKWVLMSGLAWPFKAWPRPEPEIPEEPELTEEERREHIEALFGPGPSDSEADDTGSVLPEGAKRGSGLFGRRKKQAEPDLELESTDSDAQPDVTGAEAEESVPSDDMERSDAMTDDVDRILEDAVPVDKPEPDFTDEEFGGDTFTVQVLNGLMHSEFEGDACDDAMCGQVSPEAVMDASYMLESEKDAVPECVSFDAEEPDETVSEPEPVAASEPDGALLDDGQALVGIQDEVSFDEPEASKEPEILESDGESVDISSDMKETDVLPDAVSGEKQDGQKRGRSRKRRRGRRKK